MKVPARYRSAAWRCLTAEEQAEFDVYQDRIEIHYQNICRQRRHQRRLYERGIKRLRKKESMQ